MAGFTEERGVEGVVEAFGVGWEDFSVYMGALQEGAGWLGVATLQSQSDAFGAIC